MADRQNILVLHDVVGRFEKGQIVDQDAIEGGPAEVRRLVALRAVQWTTRPATVDAPLSDVAAASLATDDELALSHRRLKAKADALKAERDDARRVAEDAARRVAELEADLLRATRPGPGPVGFGVNAFGSAAAGPDAADDPTEAVPRPGPADMAVVPVVGDGEGSAGEPVPLSDEVSQDVPAPPAGPDVPTVPGPGIGGRATSPPPPPKPKTRR